MIGAVVLAAGRGSRLGGVAKALIERDGESFLARIRRSCDGAGVAPIVAVVAEPFAGRVSEAARALGIEVALNLEPERGMGSSVAVGYAHATGWQGVDAALLWPVDHPWVEVATVTRLIEAMRATPSARVAIPVVGQRGGHPALVRRDLWPELTSCAGLDGGARAVFRHNEHSVVRIAVTDSGVVRDVDQPSDLE